MHNPRRLLPYQEYPRCQKCGSHVLSNPRYCTGTKAWYWTGMWVRRCHVKGLDHTYFRCVICKAAHAMACVDMHDREVKQ